MNIYYLRWLVVLLFIANASLAQSHFYYYNNRYYESDLAWEAGGSAGIMNAFTDLGGKKGNGKGFIKDLNLKNTKPSFGFFITALYQYKIGVRLEATFGTITAYDSILKKVQTSAPGRYERNLSFKSSISDVQLSVELHPVFIFGNFDEEAPRLSPYAVAGIGYFSFDPQAKLNGQWYSLQPLHTEGQGFREYRTKKPYKLQQVNFPLGVGLMYEAGAALNFRLELVHRILMTDYLDDVSTSYIDPSLFTNYLPGTQALLAAQLADRKAELNPVLKAIPGEQRGGPKDKDAYFTMQFKMSFVLGRKRR